jgi:hypothetical protein
VLEGSVRKAENRVRIAGQLIDAATGAHLWADRFDSEIEDIFDLQDRVTSSVIGAISPQLERAEIERAQRKPTENFKLTTITFGRSPASINSPKKRASRLSSSRKLPAASIPHSREHMRSALVAMS